MFRRSFLKTLGIVPFFGFAKSFTLLSCRKIIPVPGELTNSPENRVFYVDLSQLSLSEAEAESLMEKLRSQFQEIRKSKRII